jgi:PAS domain S-box-containing protein
MEVHMFRGRDRNSGLTAAGPQRVDWLDRLPTAACVLAPDGQVLQWNDGAVSLFGWSGAGPVRLARPETKWLVGLLQAVGERGDAATVISRTVRGRRLVVELRCRGLDDGRVLVLFRDCTSQLQRRQGRQGRRSGEHQLRVFLDRLPEPVIIEQDGTIAYSNPAAAQLAGCRPDERLRGRPVAAALPQEVLDRLAAEPAAEVETVLERENRRRAVCVRALPIHYRGRPAAVLLATDVTQRRTAEQGLLLSRESLRRSEEQLRQAQKMDAIGRMAAGIAHDFNNLLTAIHGHVQLVLDDLPEDAAIREDVLGIRQVADRAAELTRDLLTFARKQPAHVQPVDVNAVVRDLERLLDRLLPAGIALRLELGDGLPPALTDRGQLEQVLVNLVVNARDAMAGGGTIGIRTGAARLDELSGVRGEKPADGEYVQLAISDTGSGMSAAVQSRMFEPFFTTKPKGTGLGLPIVYSIIAQGGGHISVYSEEGAGTTIKVYLPAAAAAGEPRDRESRADDLPCVGERQPQDSTTVLLVEDDRGIRSLAERTLRRSGMEVVSAATGEEALRLAASMPGIDVVVTDLIMPSMNGDELVERISRCHPRASVVLMSGFSEDTLLRRGRISSTHHFLEKPFTQQLLLQTVRRALSG